MYFLMNSSQTTLRHEGIADRLYHHGTNKNMLLTVHQKTPRFSVMQLPEAEELPVKHSDCDITEPKVFKKVSKSLLYEKSSDGG